MNSEDRDSKIGAIVKSGNSVGSKRIIYKNDKKNLDAYSINVKYLVFNQYNGRIGTWVKTHETVTGTKIDASTEDGEKTIIDFLWESKEDKNKDTMLDIEEKGQLEVGIVTRDGVVIDGNRRAMLLKKIDKKNDDSPTYFNAVVLEDRLDDNPKEIRKLETMYQLGIDHPVDYNAIEKYLKCKELFEEDEFTLKEIGKMMGEKPAKIEEYLQILDLMEKFLETYGYKGIYTYLTDINAEGPFVDLNRYLKKYKSNKGNIKGRDWKQEADDIKDLETVYYDYIRAGYGTHKIRCIGDTATKKGFFNNKAVWDEFLERYEKYIEPVNNQEKSLETLRTERPSEKVQDLIKGRDRDWKNEVCGNDIKLDNNLKGNLGESQRALDDVIEEGAPLIYLKRALNALIQVDTKNDAFKGNEVEDTVAEINKLNWKFKKILKK